MREFLGHLRNLIIVSHKELFGFDYKECGYKTGNALPPVDESFTRLEKGQYWGNAAHVHAWMHKKIEIPENMIGKNIVLHIDTQKDGWNVHNPQFIAYLDGVLVQGLDTNHREVYLDCAKSEYDLYLYAYTSSCADPLELRATLFEYDEVVKKLYYTLSIALDTCAMYDKNDKIYADVEKCTIDAINLIDTRKGRSEEFLSSAKKALDLLESRLCGKKTEKTSVVCIGHTHIDVAWLWTLAQTREKVQRSFSNVVALMKKYPEYKFMSSQAQLYKHLKEEAPEIYEEVKKLVKEGRWEVEGAMWVEADCNLSSGESLVRQILYGKQFFKDEFGVDCKVLWLPDVFGYSAALPQILQKSGVDKFVTSKISWNETNRMPCDMFRWHGIDGTEIFTYFLTAQDKIRGAKPVNYSTYNAEITPRQLQGSYERFTEKGLTDEVMITYGFGDGGGGPTAYHLDNYEVLKKGFPGVPTPKQEFAGTFLERMKKKAFSDPSTPHWYGELYLEYHRGTYTSMAKNKKYNRKSEFLFEKAETLSVAAQKLLGKEYPKEDIYNSWETILLNQFHDVIPGSSIKDVYDVSWQQYEDIKAVGEKITDGAQKDILENVKTDGGILVFNNNSFTSSGTVKVGGKTVYVENVPAKGYAVVKKYNDKNAVKVTENSIENKFFKLVLDKKGAFTKIYDKKNKRDVLAKGKRATLTAYEDIPRAYDNWELSNYYTEKSWEIDEVVGIKPLDDGARAGLEITKKFLDSTITQTIWLYEDTAKIDFENDIDWKESHIVVKAHFPVDINSTRATYDIQFGNVERPTHMNTSWDAAKFEVCAHKFDDFSEYGYGVSIMNDCKYGHDIHDGVISLTLLKCGTYPNPEADKHRHEFTYSLYPHAGDFREAGTINKAYELNIPMDAYEVKVQNGKLPESFSLVSFSGDGVFCETVKAAEDRRGTIVRAYESFNRKCETKMTVGFEAKKAYICNLSEEDIREVKIENGKIDLAFKPFEIVTIRIV